MPNELRALVPAILRRACLDARHDDERGRKARTWLRGGYATRMIEVTDAVGVDTVDEWLDELEGVGDEDP